MSDKVHKLAIVKGEDGFPPPNERIIKTCREILRDAKSGKLQGLLVALAIYNPESVDDKKSTEHTYRWSDGWFYATHVAADNAIHAFRNYITEGGKDIVDPPLTEEDE